MCFGVGWVPYLGIRLCACYQACMPAGNGFKVITCYFESRRILEIWWCNCSELEFLKGFWYLWPVCFVSDMSHMLKSGNTFPAPLAPWPRREARPWEQRTVVPWCIFRCASAQECLSFQILCLKWLKCLPRGRQESEVKEAMLTRLVMHLSATLVCSLLCCSVSAWLWIASWACCCLWMWYGLVRTSACSWLTIPCNPLISLFCSAGLDSCSVTTWGDR